MQIINTCPQFFLSPFFFNRAVCFSAQASAQSLGARGARMPNSWGFPVNWDKTGTGVIKRGGGGGLEEAQK